ncbi:phage tail tape measure protein [Candidatus Pantoea alvi]|uniref:phage tail tape measure protein n=1 Tax=Enterobacter agglomerans TaxID=549 RepID=UPI000CDDF4FE|nr:phage tail tape measure protein [Pantoea agglomerans]POW57045.1 phage tail tape measure protein [Pantoea alvi]UBN52718.1 phage tail tape measure protein [Pantoea agglomerans]
MATLRELIIKISANSTSFQSEIARASRMGSDYYKTMEQGGRKASAATRETQRALADLNSQLSSVRERAAGMAGAFAGAFATSQLVHYADTWNQLSGRLRLASTSAEDFTRSQQTLMSISQRTGTSFEANANLYSRIASSLRDAGYASADVAKVTETVATSLKLSGASTEEASSVITQLSQALGSGVLRGEEFNAIMESGGRLAKFLADGLGTTIGGLRNMANNGELTTDKIVPLLTNVDQLRKEFDTLPASISGSAQKVENAFMAWVGGANNAVGASSSLSGVLDGLAKNIDTVANAAGVLVGLGVARYFGNMVTGVASATASVISTTAAEVALAEAQLRGTQVSVATARQAVYRAQQARAAAAGIEAQIAAERQLAVAQAQLNTSITARSSAAGRLTETASVMSRIGSGVLGLLGGWPGVIIAAGTAMYGVYQHTQQVHQEAVAFSDNLDAINSKLNQMSVAGLRSTSADARGSLTAQKKDLADIDEQIRQTRDSLAAMQSMEKQYDEHPWLARINNLMTVEELTQRQQEATDQLNKLEYQREQAASKVEATQKLVNDASDLATKKAIEQAGAVAILKGAYDLLNRSMSATGGATPPQYAGPVVSLAKATPQQATALEKARRDNELASLSGLQKLHRQYEYEADDLKLTGALYTQYVYNKDQAAKKDAEAAQAKKDGTAATNAQKKAEREAASVAEQYARKMADLSVAVEVQKVRATEGEKASELYAASHQAGTKWTEEQRKAIRASSTELEKWTQKADENVRKQREQIEALKDLRDAARKYQDDATLISSTAGMGDRKRERFNEQQQVDRVFDKSDKGAEAVAARTAAIDALDRKYQETAAAEANWLNGVSRGYENWLANTSNIAGTVSQGITSTMDSALDNMSAMLVGSKADWKSWGLSVLQMISKVALQMAIVNAMGSSSSSFGSILGSVISSAGGAAAGAAGGTTGAMGLSTSFSAYDEGGFTGSGGKFQPAGVVHKGEFVFTKEATERIGVANLYSMMRGYANGGVVNGGSGTPAFSSGVNRASGTGVASISINAPISIVQGGGTGETTTANTTDAARQLQGMMNKTINDWAKQQANPGGLLYRGG